jgi:glycerol-3-phosphate acyltransferase PlsY
MLPMLEPTFLSLSLSCAILSHLFSKFFCFSASKASPAASAASDFAL